MSGRVVVDLDAFDAMIARSGVTVALDRRAHRAIVPVGAVARAYARLLGDDRAMIAASYAFQSIVSRLAGPLLAGAVLLGCAPRFELDDVRWAEGALGPTIGAGRPAIDVVTPGAALDQSLRFVTELAAIVRDEVRVARRLLAGNAAAAMLATVRRLDAVDGVDRVACRDLAGRIVTELGDPAVAVLVDVDGWATFHRRTCCLLRFAGARGVCDECSLLRGTGFVDAQRALRVTLHR